MPGPEKRLPGQSNAEYERRRSDPNAEFLGAQSIEGGVDLTWVMRLAQALSRWFSRRTR